VLALPSHSFHNRGILLQRWQRRNSCSRLSGGWRAFLIGHLALVVGCSLAGHHVAILIEYTHSRCSAHTHSYSLWSTGVIFLYPDFRIAGFVQVCFFQVSLPNSTAPARALLPRRRQSSNLDRTLFGGLADDGELHPTAPAAHTDTILRLLQHALVYSGP
jgi:hypothetical protein